MNRLISKIYLFKIEFLKILVALVGLLNISLLSHFFNPNYVVLFVSFLATQIVLCSTLDFGANVLNLNSSNDTFNSKTPKFKPVSINLFSTIIALIIIGALLYSFSNSHSINLNKLFVFGSLMFAGYFSVFIMRWLTTVRKFGLVETSILYGELTPAVIRLFALPIAHYGGEIYMTLYLAICPAMGTIICKKQVQVANLSLYLYTNKVEKLSFNAYLLSILTSIKNQAINLLVIYVSSSMQLFVIISSRILGVISIISSGIFARLPNAVMHLVNGNAYYSNVLTISVLGLSLLFFIFHVVIYNVGSILLGGQLEWEGLPRLAQCFFLVLLLSTAVNYICLFLQCKGSIKKSLSTEILYIFVVITLMMSL